MGIEASEHLAQRQVAVKGFHGAVLSGRTAACEEGANYVTARERNKSLLKKCFFASAGTG